MTTYRPALAGFCAGFAAVLALPPHDLGNAAGAGLVLACIATLAWRSRPRR
jgi:hypothetical protein